MLTFKVITHTCNMGRHQTKTCNVCFKSMRSDKLKKHMKKHERGNDDNIVTKGVYDGKTEDNIVTKGPQIRYTEEQFIALKKKVSAQMEEFDIMIKLEQKLKLTVDKNGYVEIGLSQHMKDSLKT